MIRLPLLPHEFVVNGCAGTLIAVQIKSDHHAYLAAHDVRE
jgi:hypothetical protein